MIIFLVKFSEIVLFIKLIKQNENIEGVWLKSEQENLSETK